MASSPEPFSSFWAAPKARGNDFQGLPNTKTKTRGRVSSGSGCSLEGTRKLQLHLQESAAQLRRRDFNCITKRSQLLKGEIHFSGLFPFP